MGAETYAAPAGERLVRAVNTPVAPGESVTEPLRNEDTATVAAAASLYNFMLSFSANFADRKAPNPPGSGYHWSLQESRFGLSAAFTARRAAAQAAVEAAK